MSEFDKDREEYEVMARQVAAKAGVSVEFAKEAYSFDDWKADGEMFLAEFKKSTTLLSRSMSLK